MKKFNGLDWQASILGLGTAELPEDDSEAGELLKEAVAGGINYIECRYNEPGDEERVCRLAGAAAGDGTRVCVNLPVRSDITRHDISSFLRERGGWLRREQIDFLSLNGIDRKTWPAVKESGLLQQAEQSLADGEIGALGFFFRDQFLYLRQVIEGFDSWSFGVFEYSFMDNDHLPGSSGLSYTAQHNLAAIATESLKRGRLVRNIPDDIAAIWQEGKVISPTAMALSWVLHHPQVTTAVVDIQSIEELQQDIMLADRIREEGLSIREEVLISRIRDAYRNRRPVNCTTCRACMPCHNGIDAPRIFELYNDAAMYSDTVTAGRLYRLEGHDISACDDCGACARACGRNIAIPERLREAQTALTRNG